MSINFWENLQPRIPDSVKLPINHKLRANSSAILPSMILPWPSDLKNRWSETREVGEEKDVESGKQWSPEWQQDNRQKGHPRLERKAETSGRGLHRKKWTERGLDRVEDEEWGSHWELQSISTRRKERNWELFCTGSTNTVRSAAQESHDPHNVRTAYSQLPDRPIKNQSTTMITEVNLQLDFMSEAGRWRKDKEREGVHLSHYKMGYQDTVYIVKLNM